MVCHSFNRQIEGVKIIVGDLRSAQQRLRSAPLGASYRCFIIALFAFNYFDEYQTLVVEYQTLVREYQTLVVEYQTLVVEYQTLVSHKKEIMALSHPKCANL
ncbi:MAG: hypothetical protein ACRDEA_18310 [Microcystaceae cyanobacterium]